MFWIPEPQSVTIRNAAETIEWTCGPQKPVEVLVQYASAPDRAHQTEGVVKVVEYK